MNRVDQVRTEVEAALTELHECFVDGMRLTFLARNPDAADQTMLITADDPEEIIAAIQHVQGDPVTKKELVKALTDCTKHIGVFIDSVERERGIGTQKTARRVLKEARALLNTTV